MNKQLSEQGFLNYAAALICNQNSVDFNVFKSAVGLDQLEFVDVTKRDDVDLDKMLAQFDQYIDKNKRTATGSFYTPYELAYVMVKMSFYDYFNNNNLLPEKTCQTLFVEGYDDLDIETRMFVVSKLREMKVIDIACGSGVFLVATYQFVKSVYNTLNADFDPHYIIQNLWGADIQAFPLKVLRLWYVHMLLQEQITDFPQLNILHQDALLNGIDQTFDLVVGNPPYIGEKGNKSLFQNYKHLEGYEGRMDLFYFFIYKGISILKPDGLLSFITTNYWITADGAVKLRQFIKNETHMMRLINLDECKLFEDAKGMHNLIFNLSKNSVLQTKVQIIKKSDSSLNQLHHHQYSADHLSLFSENNNIVLYDELTYLDIVKKMLNKSKQCLNELVNVNQGIVSGADKVTDRMLLNHIERDDIQKGDGIFVINNQLLTSEYRKPFYKNSHIDAYFIKDQSEQSILYITDKDQLDAESTEWHHLIPFKRVLDGRREVQLGKRKWYALQWYRTASIFEDHKIVVPQRSLYNKFAYCETPFYASADVYYLTKGPLKLLLGILNSKIMYFWLYSRGKRKGKQLELYAKPLSQIPIPELPKHQQKEIVSIVEDILTLGLSAGLLDKIDHILYEFYRLTNEEIKIIEVLYNNIRRTNAKNN